jgi:ankyrin repeat protein
MKMQTVRRDDGAGCEGPVRRAGGLVHGLALLVAIGTVAIATAAGGSTPLIDAVKAGNRDEMRALLKNSASVNVPEADGTTALHWAVRADDVETVRALLRAGAKADVANRNGVTPLSLAALNGTRSVVEALIEAGADVNARLPQGQTALMMAARAGHVDALNLLLSRGADVNAREQILGETALIWAAAEDHADAIKTLVAHGADVNGRSNRLTFPQDEYGDGKSARLTVLPKGSWVPLMYAARQNATAALKALAASGADLNATDPDNMTALNVAIINAHYDAAAVLLDLGADPNIGDVTGMTPLYAAVDLNTFADTPGRPTPKASGKLEPVDIARALLEHGANPNAILNAPILVRVHDRGDGTLGAGATPLMRAAKKGDVDMMRVLLDHGADPRLRTKAGTEALMFASGLGGVGRFTAYEDKQATDADFIEAASLCLDHGADINAVNENGQTALHLAVTVRSESFIAFLIERGARVDARDKQDRTPLDVASGVGARGRGAAAPVRDSVVALLRAAMNRAAPN